MENTVHSDELQHWGIKGQKWGRRRYQNKDGSLTKAGQKRYNKEVEKLKAETAKVKEAEKAAATRKKTQAKLDKLEEKKQALEERKKALKDNPDGKKEDKPEETPEQRRERLLKSTNPKELYEGKDDLSYQEMNERIMRIDLEKKLHDRIPVEPTKEQKTAAEYMDKAKTTINSASALYKSVDDAYTTFANSSIAKLMGLDLPTGKEKPKAFDAKEFLDKVRSNKATAKEIQDGTNALKNINTAEQQYKQIEKAWGKDSKPGKNNKGNDADQKDQNQNKAKDQKDQNQTQNHNKAKDQNSKQEAKKESEQADKAKTTSNAKEQNADVNEKIRKAADALEEAAKKSSDNAEAVEKSSYELQKQAEEMINKYGDFWLPM